MRDGFINLNKAADMTSHDVVNVVRKALNTKKVGHGGTLDPFATGVLPIAVGRATKFIEYLGDQDKAYRAEILFGIETDTGDVTGNVLNRAENFTMPTRGDIEKILNSFNGKITQTPPKYSAIKINGRKAYELARKNIDFDMPSRDVVINNISIVDIGEKTLTIEVDCSKGTYIRSLAVDIGDKLNTPATLKTLQRIRFGNFLLADSITIDEVKTAGEDKIIDVDVCIGHLPKFNLPPNRCKAFCNGLSTTVHGDVKNNKIFRVYVDGEFIGVGKTFEGEIKAVKIYKLM